jgi:hypothetical protein
MVEVKKMQEQFSSDVQDVRVLQSHGCEREVRPSTAITAPALPCAPRHKTIHGQKKIPTIAGGDFKGFNYQYC